MSAAATPRKIHLDEKAEEDRDLEAALAASRRDLEAALAASHRQSVSPDDVQNVSPSSVDVPCLCLCLSVCPCLFVVLSVSSVCHIFKAAQV